MSLRHELTEGNTPTTRLLHLISPLVLSNKLIKCILSRSSFSCSEDTVYIPLPHIWHHYRHPPKSSDSLLCNSKKVPTSWVYLPFRTPIAISTSTCLAFSTSHFCGAFRGSSRNIMLLAIPQRALLSFF